MCRLLAINSKVEFDPLSYLQSFARMCKGSKEYQGHGWGYSILTDDGWKVYKSIKPVWEDAIDNIDLTKRILVHARSAFRDEGIVLENNMPFYDDNFQFIFNGELQGVSIKAEGRIGAEKIFNFIKRFDKGNILEAFERGINVINKKTRYVRAMNIILSDKERIYVNNMYNEDPGYFNMLISEGDSKKIVCSERLDIIDDWQMLPNNSIKVIE